MSDSEDGAAQRNRSRAREAALKKMKDRKERDRRGGESEDEIPSTSDKRKELQRKRMQMRESGDSLSDTGTGNQGPRSPVRSSRKGLRTGSTLQSMGSTDDLENEIDDFRSTRQMEQQDDDDEVELNDNYAEIFTVNQPLHIMPLNFMADVTAKNESSVQPLLVIPAPHPEIGFRNGFNIFKSKLYQNPDELALLSGDAEVVQTNVTKSSSELVSLLHSSGDAKTSKAADGVYEEKAPVLSDLLMTGEYLNQPIANLVSSNIDLSRVTQRTLRDVQNNIADKNLKEKIHQANGEEKAVEEQKISSISLLKEVSQIPVFDLITDPFNEYPTQPLLPTNNVSFGGQLGNWNNTASDREKLGPLALSSANASARKSSQSKSLLRINIHEMKLLSHSLMNDEELIYHSMKKAYVQYIAIFENKTMQYLSHRLLSIIDELKRFIKENSDRGITASTVDTLLLHYRDLMETLPALCELRSNVDTLAANLYNNWRNIQELRRQKGFVCTKASVTVRKVIDDEHKFDDFTNAVRGAQILVETVQHLLTNYNKTLVTSDSTTLSSTGSLQIKQQKGTAAFADSAKVNQVLEQCVNELSKYKSLQPEFVLRLTDQYAISTDQAVDVAEGKRRKLLEELRFKVVLKVNDAVITSTVAKLEYPALFCEFNKKFDFRVFNQPHNVSVDIYSFYNRVLGFDDAVFIANVPIFLPGQRVVDNQSSSKSKSAEITLPTHAFAPTAAWYSFASSPDSASHIKWSILNITGNAAGESEPVKPTIGAILISCDYEIGSVTKHITAYDGIKSDDIALIRQQITAKSPGSMTNDAYKERDFQQLLPSISNLDVNDPSSDDVVKTILMGKSASTEFDSYYLFGKHFAESFSEDNQNYENYLKFSPNLRLQLLKLRDSKPYLFTDPVPLSDAVIQRSELYKKILITEGVSMTNGVDLTSMSPRADDTETENSNRLKVKGFLDRVRNSVTALKKRNIRKSITTNNVIAEVQYFYPIVLDDVETLIPARKRDLKPVPKVRVPQAVQVSQCDVLVQVVGAKNIPLRQNDTANESSKTRRGNRGSSRGGRGSDSEGERNEPALSDDVLDANKIKEKKRARSVMEVRFQERANDTVCIEGAAPLWKQSFSYPFRAPQDDYTPSNIILVDENVTFTLFDEYIEDDAKRGGYLEGERTTRMERRYLGSFTIPFATLYQESRIEGVFRLDTPIFNFGYVPNDIEKKKLNEDSIFESSAADAPSTAVSQYNNGFFSYYWDYLGLDRTVGPALSSMGIHFRRRKRPANLDENNFLINAETLREFDYFACGKSSTYINVMLTLDPMLTPPPPQHVEISTHSVHIHDRQYCAYARQYLSELKNYSIHTRKREYQLFAQSSNGLNVFIPRFLTPMKPPMGFDTRRACLHLVSSFPFMLDAHSFIGDMDLFCTTKEAWQMGAGDEEEHASMLYNFLLYLQLTGKDGTSRDVRNSRIQVRGKGVSYGAYPSDDVIKEESLFLVICKAIPEGSSMYVLLRDHRVAESSNSTHYSSDKFLLINACNGHVYSAADQRMPISDVYCLVTSYNIWANIQEAGAPYDIEYDVLNPYHWRPFFGARMPPPLASLQTVQEEISYEPTDPTYALDIEKSLRQSIKNAIRRWRSRRYKSATTFHPDASSIIHDILPMLEDYKLLGPRAQSSTMDALSVQSIQDTINEKLKSVLRTRTLTGCPINVPYSDADAILNKVKSMCVHETNDNDAQFVMAVRVFPLVNNLVSVWIYVGTVIAKEI